MPKKQHSVLPFAVVKNDERSLVAQVLDGLRGAIASGYYKSGSLLPPMRTLSKMCGVSMIVMNEVVARLTAEGLINPRRGVGCVVVGGGRHLWKGRVLFVLTDRPGIYYVNVFASILRERLADAGYLFSQVTVTARTGGKYDLERLEMELARRPDLVVQIYVRPQITSMLAKSGVPWVFIGRDLPKAKGAAGFAKYDYAPATTAFAERCAECGIRKVLQVSLYPWCADASRRATMKAFEEIIERDVTEALGDAVYFTDDNAAQGALAAFSQFGVRMPEDVGCVTWANVGHGPVYWRSLARLEMDPVAHGEAFSAAVLNLLSGRPFPSDFRLGPVWRDGETLCKRSMKTKGRKR